MAGNGDGVQLLGYWASPFALRIKWALKLKEIHYEYVEDHLLDKSPMLLQYNPVHKKIPVLVHKAFSKVGAEQEQAAKELRENLKTLESALEGKHFFGGETIGFLDIAVGWIGCWARMNEEVAGVNMIDVEMTPLLGAWFQKFLKLPIIKECLPPQDKLLVHTKEFHKMLMAALT
uniref:Glutathione S-transferase n=1 Tax=Vitis vinifera TaxID=29760 RepID=F6H0Z9_VITVI